MTTTLHISDADAATARQNGFVQWVFALRRTLITTPVGWLLVAWFGREPVPHDQIFMWLGVFAAVWAVGLWVLRGVIREGPRLERHRARTLWVASMDGLAWGLIAWFLMGHDPIHDATLTAMLCGVVAVNAQVYVTFIRAYYVLVGVMWLVVMAGMMRIADHPHTIDYAVGLSVFVGLTLYYMRNIAKRVAQGIQLQLANASLAEQLRVALQMVRLDAATDALTGQGNRRALDELLRQQVEFAAQTGRTFSILMLDIDFFKKVNDIHGHMVGDDALRAFAQRVREHLRQGDVCARFGGEEFVAVLPGTTLETALEVAERLRSGVEAEPLLSTPLVQLTVSIGAATLAPGQTVEELLNVADAAVYAAKRGGRNQVRS
jgi:diguanylate cyclase (GGDEF)-like protein